MNGHNHPASLPADSHVHSEWSWDAAHGSMEQTCARAVALGLPGVAFTEHVDRVAWPVAPSDLLGHEHLQAYVSPDGVLTPPPLDVEGYFASVERCRALFPGLTVISGVELGEPHRYPDQTRQLLAAGPFDRVLASVHCLVDQGEVHEMPGLFRHAPSRDVVRAYLAEVARLIEESDVFSVLAHVDYPARYWPAGASPFDPEDYEEEFRHVLHLLAAGDRALEVNTRVPLHPIIVRWWREVGGQAVTLGSDAHEPTRLAHGFAEAAAVVEGLGFRAGATPSDPWRVRRGVR